jgi:hypothetical protein
VSISLSGRVARAFNLARRAFVNRGSLSNVYLTIFVFIASPPLCPYASSSQPTSSAAPSFFQVLTDPALRLVSIAAISARDTFAFFASCS